MTRNGIVSLGDFAITASGNYVGSWVTGFEGILVITAQLRLVYGSGGTTIKAYLQTGLDGSAGVDPVTPIDIWCRTFATASDVKDKNFSCLDASSDITPTDATLTDNTAVDGILGDRFRLKLVVAGTYGGSTVLSARVHPKQ